MTPEFHHPQFIKQAYVDARNLRNRTLSEVLQARIFLQAVDDLTDIKRFFHIFTYPTLAKGIWAIKVVNGRIGSKGSTRHYHFDDPNELQTKLRLLLRKRLNSTKRLGCNYRITNTTLSHYTIDELVASKVKTAKANNSSNIVKKIQISSLELGKKTSHQKLASTLITKSPVKRENDPKVRQQKLADTIAVLNKKMGGDTIVTATSPLKSHWLTK